MKQEIRHRKPQKIKRVRLITGLLGIIVFAIVLNVESYAYWQTDPRIPAANHTLSAELAPAIGRIRSSSNTLICTAWIAPGGVLITAGHCNILGDILEFNVPGSASCGQLSAANSKDQYVITNIVASNDGGFGNDWKIFEVQDNPVTGYQPIEAQLKYINFVKPDVDLTSIPTVRQISYGIDTSPNGSCSGGGTLNNSSSGTLQTAVGDNLTSGSTSATLITDNDDLWFSSGSSGSPIIDESTGNAIAINNGNDGQQKGTTLHRSGFWTAFQNTQTSVSLSVYQKNEGGSNISGSTIGHWNGTGFAEQAVDGSSGATKLSIATQVGNVEVLRGDQDVFLNPKEKFNRWTNQEDVRNHQRFQMEPGMTQLTSQFKNTQSTVTIKNYYPEYTSSGAGGLVAFKDPWLIDYADPDFNNETRNRGFNAEFVTHTAPFAPGFSSINGKLYNGVFLNENITFDPDFNNYSVSASNQTINFGGVLGNRETTFYEWTGVNADFQDADEEETAVVFTSSTAEARANLKIQGISNSANTFKAYQRKAVRSRDGWQHMVYESLGHIWYEAKSPTGDWEFISSSDGKSPSIDVNTNAVVWSGASWQYMTAVAWQEGSTIKLQTFRYEATGEATYISAAPYDYFATGEASSYDTQPNVVWTDNEELLLIYRTSSGLAYKVYSFNNTHGYLDQKASGTIANTSGAKNVAISSFTSGTHTWLDIVYEKDMGYLGAPYYVGTEIKHANLRYISGGSTATVVVTPHVISNSSIVRNKEPSVVTISSLKRIVGWISAITTNSSWDPQNTRATIASLEWGMFGWMIARTNNDHHVRSVSVSKKNDNSEYYAAWSQIYDQSGWIDYNKFVEGSALSQFKGLNTKGWNVQLTEAVSANDIHAFSYYPKAQPYYWLSSNSLGSYLKQHPMVATQTRGIVLTDTAQSTAFTYSIGEIMVDDEPLSFVSSEKKQTSSTSDLQLGEGEMKYQGLHEVMEYLRSEPFQLNSDTRLTFEEQFNFGDSTGAMKLLGADGFLQYSISIVDHSTNKVKGTLRTHTVSGKSMLSPLRNSWDVNLGSLTEGIYRIEIAVETDLEGLYPVIENTYFDDFARGKVQPENFENLELDHIEEISAYALIQNYPNPFNPTTQIEYQIPTSGLVQLEVFDILGRKVQTLVNENKEVGKYTITFDASGLASGMYLYRLTSGTFVASKKLFLMK